MDITAIVTQWIEDNLGKVISSDLKEKIVEESSPFDVDNYVRHLLDTYFNENAENLEKDILKQSNNSYQELDLSEETENDSQDSLDLESNAFNSNLIEDITEITERTPKEFVWKYLKELEACSEDISLSNWSLIRKNLQNLLERNKEHVTLTLVLKVFQKFLSSPNQPQIVCEAFISLTEVAGFHFDLLNINKENVLFEEVYDLKEEKWFYTQTQTSSQNGQPRKEPKSVDVETLVRSMWLLIECQKQMPEKWMRFNERRLREIIFSFIHLLSYTTTLKFQHEKLSGLELLSVLSPTARWCRHWCHTANGRFLLCSALRKYRNFFTHIVDIILINMNTKKHLQFRLEKPLENEESMNPKMSAKISSSKVKKDIQKLTERDKCIRSAPTMLVQKTFREKTGNKGKDNVLKFVMGNIPETIVNQAVFLHCVSLVVYLVQYRSGRSLFPVNTELKKNLLSAQDLTLSMIEFMENNEKKEKGSIDYTSEYRRHINEMISILKQNKGVILSSRMSAERFPVSH